MIFEIKGSAKDPYKVDTEKLTCTCPRFKYHGSHFPVESEERLCKHLQSVLEEHPELAPVWYQMKLKAEEPTDGPTEDPDGKVRYSISFFDLYAFDIKSVLRQFESDIKKYMFCGSYRRKCAKVSDLDVLIILNEGKSPNQFLDYLEGVMDYEKLWRGDKKASYKIDGIVQVDFKFVPEESWAFSTLHFTGSKSYNIALRQRAKQLGYSLSEYGLKDINGVLSTHGLETEEQIHEFLRIPYKEPWDRN